MVEFIIDLKQEFSGEDNKTIKVAGLKKIEQKSETIEEFCNNLKLELRLQLRQRLEKG